jgi:hypothetical protein
LLLFAVKAEKIDQISSRSFYRCLEEIHHD